MGGGRNRNGMGRLTDRQTDRQRRIPEADWRGRMCVCVGGGGGGKK